MDPLSILASSAALFDFLQEGYRYSKDVVKAPEERLEFQRRLDYVSDIRKQLDDQFAKEDDPENSQWVQILSPQKNANSPLAQLLGITNKMLVILKTKETGYRKIKDLRWHSDKKSLEAFFVAIDGCCMRISAYLSAGIPEISRLSKETNTLTKDTNEITKQIAARQEAQIEAERLLREEAERKAVEKWLSPLDFQARQQEIFDGAVKIGSWFISLEEFKLWKSGELELLRCHGKLGTGKTVLSSIVVDHLKQDASSSTPVLCLFLEKAASSLHSPKNLLGSLVKQLVQYKEFGISHEIETAWKRDARMDARPNQDTLKKLLKSETEEYEQVHVVIDALDEASEESRFFIERELRRVSPKLKLLTMGRMDEDDFLKDVICDICKQNDRKSNLLPVYYRCSGCKEEPVFDLCPDCMAEGLHACPNHPHDEILLPKVLEVEIKVPWSDLETYVKSMIKDQFPDLGIDLNMESEHRSSTDLGLYCSKDQAFFDEIVEAILTNSDRKFLFAKLYLKSISNKASKKKIKGALAKLREAEYKLSDRIDTLYDQDLKTRIKGQDQDRAERGTKLLLIVYFSKRNLTFREISQLWAVGEAEEIDTDYDPDGELDDPQRILNSTGGFITIGRDGIVRLDDKTLAEYFDKNKDEWFPGGQKTFAHLCLRYLGFDTFSKPCSAEKFSEREKKHPFLAYAVQYWGDHVREAGLELDAIAAKYLQDDSRMDAYIQCAWETDTHDYDRWDVRKQIHALHVCAWFNLSGVISELGFKSLKDLDIREGTYGQTPLMYACRRGNVEIARHLLDMGADVNKASGRGRTALHEAVLKKNLEMVQLLLKDAPEIDVNIRNPMNYNRPALMVAVRQGNADIAQAILKHENIKIDMQDSQGNTALSLAALLGMDDVVDALLAGAAKMDLTETSSGRSAMVMAAEKNHSSTVSRLLNHGADPNLPKTLKGETPALRAAEVGAAETLQVLLDFKADVSAIDEDGRTLMHCAAEYGHLDILRSLKEYHNNVNIPCHDGMTPLHSACRMGQEESVGFLLDNGADSAIKDKYERTAFTIAWQYGHTDIMDLLKDKGTNQDVDSAQDIQANKLPIWSLVRTNSLGLNLKRDKIDLAVKEPVTGYTALHCAVEKCSQNETPAASQVLEDILSTDATFINEKNRVKQTPLHLAAWYSCIDCISILLKYNPKLNELDNYGYTPLAIACNSGTQNLAIAVLLVKAGAQLHDVSFAKQKLLFAAIEMQSVIAVKNLMAAGADRLAQDEDGRTADMLAKKFDEGNGEILKILQSHRSFMYHVGKPEKARTSEVSELEALDEEPEHMISFRPAFPQPIGLAG